MVNKIWAITDQEVFKVFEKLIFSTLNSSITRNNIISNNQFGFTKEKYTEQAALKLIMEVLPCFGKNDCIAVLFLDFTWAFDSIDRSKLVHKLYKYGFRGPVYNLLASYLHNRRQFTSINDSMT